MTEVLYRKWRPKQFSDIVGQSHVVQTLTRAVQSDRVAHAYLFCGPRGTGKTSTARILAKSINCQLKDSCSPSSPCRMCSSIDEGVALDLIEIDAASNRGIDDIRDLREKARYAPNEASHKVYIIDEAHMLTDQAFNALLKTLEEPPDKVVFILATTESHKIPATILSRCQRYDFARITTALISKRLSEICKSEGFNVEIDALKLIANLASGALRDAINILEQSVVSDDPPISETKVRNLLDIGDDTISLELSKYILDKNTTKALETVNAATNSGIDLRYIHMGLIKYLRAILLIKSNIKLNDSFSEDIYKKIELISQRCEMNSILSCLKILIDPNIKPDPSNPLGLELAIIEIEIQSGNYNDPIVNINQVDNSKTFDDQKEENVQDKKERNDSIKIIKGKKSYPDSIKDIDEADSLTAKDTNTLNNSEGVEILENGWQSILDSLRYTKGQKFNLKALLVTCTSRKITGDSILLGFSHPSHRERMEHELTIPESRKILNDTFANIMSKRYEIIVENNNVTSSENKKNSELDSPLIRVAQSMGAQIIEQTKKRELDN